MENKEIIRKIVKKFSMTRCELKLVRTIELKFYCEGIGCKLEEAIEAISNEILK